MKKLCLFSIGILFFVGGCSFDVPQQTNVDVNAVVGSGSEMLSGAWNTTKETVSDYYQEQVRPTIDTAIEASQQGVDKLTQEVKNQYNSGVTEFQNWMQGQADAAKEQAETLKVN